MYEELKQAFQNTFSKPCEHIFSAPGRTELGGNHTDHQHGRVLAAAVDLRTDAAVRLNGERCIRVLSEGYPLCEVSLDSLFVSAEEAGTTRALIRGVAAAFAQRGCELQGFDAYCVSSVLPGSGLSSSAAFEVLIGTVINSLFFGGALSAVEIAQIGQYAENVYFGKPCGLMDQTASSVGSIIGIDFKDPAAPVVERIDFDFSACGYALCIIDSGADHAALTHEYAAIPEEMRAVAAVFGKEYLRDVDENEFYSRIREARAAAGDRAVLRAMHFFDDDRRVSEQIAALKSGDFDRFLALSGESGRSSWLYLQNIVPTGATAHQDMALALALAQKLLGGRGAVRVHGGGFAGTLQAFVPKDMLISFKTAIEATLGEGACHVLSIDARGGVMVE